MFANILKALAQIMIAVAIIVLAFVVASFKPQVENYLKLKARHDCATDFRLEYTDEKTSTKVINPIEDKYQKCLLEAK